MLEEEEEEDAAVHHRHRHAQVSIQHLGGRGGGEGGAIYLSNAPQSPNQASPDNCFSLLGHGVGAWCGAGGGGGEAFVGSWRFVSHGQESQMSPHMSIGEGEDLELVEIPKRQLFIKLAI